MSNILTYEKFIKKNNVVDVFIEKIPKIIFRTGKWKLEDIPNEVVAVYERCIKLNPEHDFVYFDNDDCVSFIKEFYPKYIPYYNKLIATAYKADLFRYLLLFKYGGCYGDMTQEIYIPYDELCEDFDRVLCRDSLSSKLGLYNALMCVKPLDSMVGEVLEISKVNISEENYTKTPLGITGPVALGQAFTKVFRNSTIGREIKLKENNGSLILNFRLNGKGEKFIFDERKIKIIGKPKIDNHQILLYDENNIHYHYLWRNKKVFKK
jgi:mannosyltransferase OCH1-like enzyme